VRHVATLAAAFLLVVCLAVPVLAEEHVPGATWMRYTDVGEAGFDPAKLEAARKTWESLPSSAFMVVADGAVVAAWGDVSRRFMCHSVRKSFPPLHCLRSIRACAGTPCRQGTFCRNSG
jgi:hypothetical protein